MLVMAMLALATGCRAPVARPPFYRLPAGFSIEAAASPSLLGPVSTFTFDSRGRPVVVKDLGFATLLLDNNKDGVFETEKILSTAVRQLRGLWFDGRMLYLIGSHAGGQYGLYRLEDRNGDDEMDSVEFLSALEDAAAGTYDMRRGPEGLALVHNGKLLGWSDELQTWASGFVNSRFLAFDSGGEAFVGETGRDEDPGVFFAPPGPRMIHAVSGGDYGVPSHRFGLLPAMTGRASAGGLEFYEHDVYPPPFRGVLFDADASRHAIVARKLVRDGATYRMAGEIMAEFASNATLAVSGLQVGPDGFVHFAAGKGLYRIRYTPSWAERWERWRTTPRALPNVRQPQPWSSWGHAALARQKDLLGPLWGEALEAIALQTTSSAADRVQAILLLLRFGPQLKAPALKRLLGDREPTVRAVAAYVSGRQSASGLLGPALADPDALVRRRTAEAAGTPAGPNPYQLLGDPDRFVRHAARQALGRTAKEEWRSRLLAETHPRTALEGMLLLVNSRGDGRQEDRTKMLDKLLPMLADPKLAAADRLDALQLFGAAAVDFGEAALRKEAAPVLLEMFRGGAGSDDALNRETAVALARAGGNDVIQVLLDAMAKAGPNRPLQFHYAQCLALIADGWTPAQKETLVDWFAKAAQWPEFSVRDTRTLSMLFDLFTRNRLTNSEARGARFPDSQLEAP